MIETAQEFKAGEATVYRFLLKNGIPTRSRAELNADGKLWTELKKIARSCVNCVRRELLG